MTLLNFYLAAELENVRYIAPLRANAERYYRAQDLSVNEVDFQGKNLAMFIKNLSEKESREYSTWLLGNFGFDLIATSEGGHLSLKLVYKDSESGYKIADMGFGFSQILPIITQLWHSNFSHGTSKRAFIKSNNSYIIIEQPELHLHPRFQAKIVDVFVKVINLSKEKKIGLNLIIETHSETIINQIGHRIAQKSLNKDDVSINIFDKKSPEHPTKVKFSNYDENGFLNDWPWGFFEPELD